MYILYIYYIYIYNSIKREMATQVAGNVMGMTLLWTAEPTVGYEEVHPATPQHSKLYDMNRGTFHRF